MGTPNDTPRQNHKVATAYLFLFGVIGTVADLFLSGHTEPGWQLAPVTLCLLAIPTILTHLFFPRAITRRLLQTLSVCMIISALTGIILHSVGNAEFELEMYPGLSGLDLLWETMTGATPVLAPGAMALLGTLGLLSASPKKA